MIDQEIYLRETAMCRELYQKNKGCNWGKCEECGVLPLLNKLSNDEILEDPEEIKNFKNKILK